VAGLRPGSVTGTDRAEASDLCETALKCQVSSATTTSRQLDQRCDERDAKHAGVPLRRVRAGEVRCEKFLYELKAGPAGGRRRRPSSRRQHYDGDQGAGLTCTTVDPKAAEASFSSPAGLYQNSASDSLTSPRPVGHTAIGESGILNGNRMK
jgi:hypothetical protein